MESILGFKRLARHAVLIAALSLGVSTLVRGAPLSTAFTYQGRLVDGGVPAEGDYDLEFTLWDSPGTGCPPGGGNQIGSAAVVAQVTVTGGLFTVQLNQAGEFGEQAFNGEARWLQIAVSPAGVPPPTTLCPRQPVTSVPYALQTRGIFVNHAGRVGINTTEPGDRLDVAGNIRTSGTSARVRFNETDNPDEDFAWVVNNGNLFASELNEDGGFVQRRLVIEGTTGNVGIGIGPSASPGARLHIGGTPGVDGIMFPDGTLQSTAATGNGGWGLIGNAGTNPATNFLGTTDNQALEVKVNSSRALRLEPNASSPNLIAGYAGNTVSPGVVGATVSGGGLSGSVNSVTGDYGTVGGGWGNQASSSGATVGGGTANQASASNATVGGGIGVHASGNYATASGGLSNVASGEAATVPGGQANTAAGAYSLAAGLAAKANHDGAFVWADSTHADFASTGINQFLIRAGGGVGIGTTGPNGPLHVQSSVNIVSGTNFADRVAALVVGDGDGTGDAILMDGNQIEAASGIDLLLNYSSPADIIINQGGGKVGIGTIAPEKKLQVNVSGTDGLQIQGDGTGFPGITIKNDTAVTHSIFDSGGDFKLSGALGANMIFQVVGPAFIFDWFDAVGEQTHERMRITAFGDVGIGTDDPQADLHVVGSPTLGSLLIAPDEAVSGDDTEIQLAEDDDFTYGMTITYDGGNNRLYIGGKSSLTAYGPHVGINRDNGNVGIGIGTADPTDKLEVLASGAQNAISAVADADGHGAVYGETSGPTASAGAPVWSVKGYNSFGDCTGYLAYVERPNDLPTAYAVRGETTSGSDYAGYFVGNVHVTNTLTKGGGSFKIDHPLDPENKYLSHSFVESPDMKNIYDGIVVLDANGEATVTMPDWFEAINRDFRYQLTCIGAFAPVYVAEELSNNHFKIAGGEEGMKVSWQITGIRQDAFANANRIPVEEDKPEHERGRYMHPEAFGFPREMSVNYVEPPQEAPALREEDDASEETADG